MIIRKIICLLFAVLLVRSGIAQENPYDNAIGEAISRSDWFETRVRYERTADSLSDYMRLFSGALLDHNFNNPAGAVEKIQRMYDEYNAQMGGNFFSLFWMMSDNLAKLGHFNAAHDICTSLLAQGRDYMDEGTRTAFETNAVLFALLFKNAAEMIVAENRDQLDGDAQLGDVLRDVMADAAGRQRHCADVRVLFAVDMTAKTGNIQIQAADDDHIGLFFHGKASLLRRGQDDPPLFLCYGHIIPFLRQKNKIFSSA